ncbi:MAG: hypothetical protein FWD82_07020 [Defluviitaleaceae bacterium]|nr:hypothetical protein [Defluviitaleaceae bacterium]
MSSLFNIDEKSIIRIYKEDINTREDTIITLNAILPHIELEEMKNVIISIIEKIEKISDEDFNRLDLSETLFDNDLRR